MDPGDEIDRITQTIESAGVDIHSIVLTHAHLDHIGAVGPMKQYCNVDICLHREDLVLYENLPEHARMFGMSYEAPPPVDRFLEEGDEIVFGNICLKILHTPGHSPGGISLLADDVVFVGDALFAGSIGRTDLPGGSYAVLINSIKQRLLTLNGDTRVYPGHGPPTSIQAEKRSNPFL